MSAFDKAFGANKSEPMLMTTHVFVDESMTMQERMVQKLLKTLIPNFDFEVVNRLTNDLGNTLLYFKGEMDRISRQNETIIAQNVEILRKLGDG